MKIKLSKSEIQEEVKKVFSKNPSKEEIKKIKRLANSKNIKLKEYRKLFCKKCFVVFNSNNSEIRIKKGLKIIRCKNCGKISRYKLR